MFSTFNFQFSIFNYPSPFWTIWTPLHRMLCCSALALREALRTFSVRHGRRYTKPFWTSFNLILDTWPAWCVCFPLEGCAPSQPFSGPGYDRAYPSQTAILYTRLRHFRVPLSIMSSSFSIFFPFLDILHTIVQNASGVELSLCERSSDPSVRYGGLYNHSRCRRY